MKMEMRVVNGFIKRDSTMVKEWLPRRLVSLHLNGDGMSNTVFWVFDVANHFFFLNFEFDVRNS